MSKRTETIQVIRKKINKLSQGDLEEQFELFKSLKARNMHIEIYQELLAQELNHREQHKERAS